MRPIAKLAALLLLSTACYADLTTEQKTADFMQLAGLYAKNYAPYEWKRDVIGFDLYNLKPWLTKVNQTKTDLEFWDLCVQYVAALQDSHDEFTLASNYYSYLHFDVDIYDGKVLVDGIDRTWLPRADYPFAVGDEVISVDGVPVQDLITKFIPFAANGSANTSSRRRLAADAITFRIQAYMPRAHEVPEKSDVVIQRANGNTETYSIKWDAHGTPITSAGIVPSPRVNAVPGEPSALSLSNNRRHSIEVNGRAWHHSGDSDEASPADAWGLWQGDGPDVEAEPISAAMKPLYELQQMSALQPESASSGFGSLTPVFNPPPGFKLRLGASRNDFFLSGTYMTGGKTVGFLRIPTMAPASPNTAIQQFATEIAFLDKNTDVLLLDVMHNGGGSLCYTESLMSMLTSGQYTAANYNIRATAFWLAAFGSNLQAAKDAKSPQWMIDLYGAYVSDIQAALKDNRSMTGSLPICGVQSTLTGLKNAYSKPIAVLVDEFSLSAAEAFSMMIQDAGRATIIGQRTDGGGGNPASYSATTYSEGSTRVTRTFVVRGKSVQTPGYPASNWLENTGVYPDIAADIMTRDDLINGGANFLLTVGQALLTIGPK